MGALVSRRKTPEEPIPAQAEAPPSHKRQKMTDFEEDLTAKYQITQKRQLAELEAVAKAASEGRGKKLSKTQKRRMRKLRLGLDTTTADTAPAITTKAFSPTPKIAPATSAVTTLLQKLQGKERPKHKKSKRPLVVEHTSLTAPPAMQIAAPEAEDTSSRALPTSAYTFLVPMQSLLSPTQKNEHASPAAKKKNSKKRKRTEEEEVDHRTSTEKYRDTTGMPDDFPENMHKYWFARHQLFSRFDEGIQLDLESWYSVTPEAIAAEIAEICSCGTVIDAFCGVGGNTIQFAQHAQRVIAIDIDPVKIAFAKHNAAIYGVADRIDFIIGDFMQLADTLKGDVCFLSPPWGGPDYALKDSFSLSDMTIDGNAIFDKALRITENIVYFLPRNTARSELFALAAKTSTQWCQPTFSMLKNRCKALTTYYGALVETEGAEEEIEDMLQVTSPLVTMTGQEDIVEEGQLEDDPYGRWDEE